jgi:enoyl-CoA hydratase/carnithine racemase
VTLNRPHRQNAWNKELGIRYFTTLGELAHDPEVRVIVVSGAGGSFCTGADGEVLSGLAEEDAAKPKPKFPYWYPLSVGKPIIGAISGPCFGVGLQQALCLDFRFAGEDAKFSTAYVRRGLVAEMGMSWMLPRVAGAGHAAEMLLSGRVVRAAEAERIGLANRVLPAASVVEETIAFARTMAASCSPRSMREMKRQLYLDLMSSLMPAYERSQDLLEQAFTWPDFGEGVRSWKESRPPRFPPLAPELGIYEIEVPSLE